MNAKKEITNSRLILVAFGTVLLMTSSAVVSNSTSYFVTAVTEELGITRAAFSVYYTIISIMTAVGSVLCGTLIPKIGNRKAFLVGTVGVTCGFLVLSRLTSLIMVYIGAVLIGFCQAFIVVPPVSVVNSWFPKKHNGLVMGMTMAGTGVGGIAMAQIMPRVVANVSWRTGYLVSAIMFCVMSLIANALCGGEAPEPDVDESKETAPSDTKAKKKEAMDMKRIFSVAFFFMVIGCMSKCLSAVFNQHYSAHLQDSFSTEQVALAMTVFNVVLVIMKTSMGAIYDKLKYKGMIIAIFATSFGYWGWMSKNFAVVLIATVFVMFCCSADTVSAPLFLGEAFGKKFASAAWGICWGALYAGNAIGAVMWGAIYDHYGAYNPGLRMQPLLVGITCCLWFIAVFLGKKKFGGDEA